MKTIKQFIQEHGLTMSHGQPKATTEQGWAEGSRTYRFTIKGNGKKISGPFTMGPGLTDDPDLPSVLDCLASDAHAGQESFGEFCREMGYDEDSRKAKKTYDACVKTYDQLVELLGDEAAQELMYDTERQ